MTQNEHTNIYTSLHIFIYLFHGKKFIIYQPTSLHWSLFTPSEKMSGFLMFSGGAEREQLYEMDQYHFTTPHADLYNIFEH